MCNTASNAVRSTHRLLRANLLLVCLAGTTRAQDSVATLPGLPGDALDAYRVAAPSEQFNDYVVDLGDLTSSWGGRFALGPVMKSSASTAPSTFNHLIASQAASNRFLAGPLPRSSYLLWSSAGDGVSSTANTSPGMTVVGAGHVGQRLGLAMLEFGAGLDGAFGTGDDENNVIAGALAFQFQRPNRVLVTRINAASNKLTASMGNTATANFGIGGVDELSTVTLLGDGVGLFSASRLLNKDWFRVDALARDATRVNRLQQNGINDNGATVRVLETVTALITPSIIPESIAGRPVLIGTSFASNFVYESTPSATSTTRTYLPGSQGSSRGAVTFTAGVFAPVASGAGDVGTCAVLSRADGVDRTRGISIFGVNTDGSVDGQVRLELPSAPGGVMDPTDGFDPAARFATPMSELEFTNFQSQASFRGGSGQVAAVVLPEGDLLAASVVNVPESADGTGGSDVPQGLHNFIAVSRVDAQTGTPAWTIAAHTGDPDGAAGGFSKALLGDYGADGTPGTGDPGEGDGAIDATPIGRLALNSEVALGATHGASFSSPAMDRAGNLYFLAGARLNRIGGPVFRHVLVKANYDPPTPPTPPAPAGSYRLEVIAEVDDIVPGLNSARNYRIAYMGVADGDSIDSGAIWAGSTVQDSIAGVTAAARPAGDPMALGALVFRAKIVYDFDQDGQFIDPESAGGPPSPDQAYNVAMLLMPRIAPGDYNRDGAITSQDFFEFLGNFFTGGADYNGDGATTSQDFFNFLADFFGG